MKKMTGYDVTHDDSEMHTRIDLANAVATLTPRQQAIIALRCQGYTHASITKLLGISRTTIWADEKEALAHLADVYGPETIEVTGDENE